MDVNVSTAGAALLSGALSLLSFAIPAAAWIMKRPRRKEASKFEDAQMAVLRTDLGWIKSDLAELKEDVKFLRARIK